MGIPFPNTPAQGGDDEALAPRTNSRSLLGTQRGTDETRRLELDANRNLYAHIGADDTAIPNAVNALAYNAITNVTDNTLVTIVTYTATVARKITRISCSGTDYAKFQLVLNTTTIETKRSGPDRSAEFVFISPLSLQIGDILDIKVVHYNTSVLTNFEASIYGA